MPQSETDFIDWIRNQQRTSPLVQLAAGDDLAVLRWPVENLLLVGADQVLDGVHFDLAKHAPRDIGRKAMNRNLSDCAAMACLPAAAIATVALPRSAPDPMQLAQELYLGLRHAGDAFDCPIVGGDTATWNGPLSLSVAIIGRSDGIAPVTRSGAKPGDGIYVTGPLGGSILGRHFNFIPRIREARQLATSAKITSMIDISDGLSRDLRQICRQSAVGAIIDAARLPIHEDALALSRQTGTPPLEHALHDGEDHELLFTCPTTPPIGTQIGEITADRSVLMTLAGRTTELAAKGWEYPL
jgi:thiamine-monophosphate kinase